MHLDTNTNNSNCASDVPFLKRILSTEKDWLRVGICFSLLFNLVSTDR